MENIHGFGPSIIEKLKSNGITTIAQLRRHTYLLNEQQKIGLEYYGKISTLNQQQARQFITTPPISLTKVTVCGSYRRKCDVMNDIDFIIVSPISEFVENIKSIVVATLSSGVSKWSGIVRWSKKLIRLDVIHTTPQSYVFALLYFTGSRQNNIQMRAVAKSKGYKLDQYGLWKGNTLVKNINTEKDIYNKLDISYKPPRLR